MSILELIDAIKSNCQNEKYSTFCEALSAAVEASENNYNSITNYKIPDEIIKCGKCRWYDSHMEKCLLHYIEPIGENFFCADGKYEV